MARVTREAVLAATECVAPALEILDTRILRKDPVTGASRTIVDTVADNAANAGIVLGRERHAPEAFDLRWVGAIVKANGVVEETGLGAGVLNDPVYRHQMAGRPHGDVRPAHRGGAGDPVRLLHPPAGMPCEHAGGGRLRRLRSGELPLRLTAPTQRQGLSALITRPPSEARRAGVVSPCVKRPVKSRKGGSYDTISDISVRNIVKFYAQAGGYIALCACPRSNKNQERGARRTEYQR